LQLIHSKFWCAPWARSYAERKSPCLTRCNHVLTTVARTGGIGTSVFCRRLHLHGAETMRAHERDRVGSRMPIIQVRSSTRTPFALLSFEPKSDPRAGTVNDSAPSDAKDAHLTYKSSTDAAIRLQKPMDSCARSLAPWTGFYDEGENMLVIHPERNAVYCGVCEPEMSVRTTEYKPTPARGLKWPSLFDTRKSGQ